LILFCENEDIIEVFAVPQPFLTKGIVSVL